MRITAIKLRDHDFGSRWNDVVEDRREYSDFLVASAPAGVFFFAETLLGPAPVQDVPREDSFRVADEAQ